MLSPSVLYIVDIHGAKFLLQSSLTSFQFLLDCKPPVKHVLETNA